MVMTAKCQIVLDAPVRAPRHRKNHLQPQTTPRAERAGPRLHLTGCRHALDRYVRACCCTEPEGVAFFLARARRYPDDDHHAHL